MDTKTTQALLTAFQVEYGQDATLHLLTTDDDDTAHIEVRGTAIKVVVASDMDNEAAELFAHAPELAAAFVRVSAERDRIAQILAVERGDESQAPEGWRRNRWDRWPVVNADGRLSREVEIVHGRWCWFILDDDDEDVAETGVAPTAREAMEAADAALASAGGGGAS